jgi:hypothetical protein
MRVPNARVSRDWNQRVKYRAIPGNCSQTNNRSIKQPRLYGTKFPERMPWKSNKSDGGKTKVQFSRCDAGSQYDKSLTSRCLNVDFREMKEFFQAMTR